MNDLRKKAWGSDLPISRVHQAQAQSFAGQFIQGIPSYKG